MDPQVIQQSVPINPPPPPSKPRLPLIIAGLFLSLFILVGSYMVFGTKKPSPPTPPVSQPSPTIVPTVDATTNWKVFQSSYGYSLKYPAEWEIKTADWQEGALQYGLQTDDEVIIRYTEPNQIPHGGFSYGSSLALKIPQDNPKNLTSREWAEEELSGGEITINFSNIKIFGIDSTMAITHFNGINYFVFIPYNRKIYKVSYNYFSTEDKTKDYDIFFTKILSTFKFLE